LLKQFVIAVQAYVEAYHFIVKNKWWKWVLFPGIVYALLFVISIYFFIHSANMVIEWVFQTTQINIWTDKINSAFLNFLLAFNAAVLWLTLLLFYFSLLKYFWLIIGSPVFAYLSKKTEGMLEGKQIPFEWKKLKKSIYRAIKLALRNAAWQSLYLILLVLLACFPIIGWVAPAIAVFIECYYYGFSMLDYACERKNFSASVSIQWLGKHKGLAVGNGLIFYLLHLIPVIGWISAPAYAIIAATFSIYEPENNSSNIAA
jgi:CysZ protein